DGDGAQGAGPAVVLLAEGGQLLLDARQRGRHVREPTDVGLEPAEAGFHDAQARLDVGGVLREGARGQREREDECWFLHGGVLCLGASIRVGWGAVIRGSTIAPSGWGRVTVWRYGARRGHARRNTQGGYLLRVTMLPITPKTRAPSAK